MKQVCLSFYFVLLHLAGVAQNVTVSGALSGNGTYANLSAAFAAINSAVQTDATISITITNNTTEPVTGAVLNAGTWTGILIRPDGNRTLSGAVNPGLPLIDFNGADHVTIDGIGTGGNAITIVNTTAAATSGTSTIRFIGGATGNLITHCAILGSFSAAVGTNGGNIYFATDALTGNGNDNNAIVGCRLGPAGNNLPTKCIYGNGSTSSLSASNSGMIIRENEFYDYFGAAFSSAAVYVGNGNTDWEIGGNKFYQTQPRAQTAGVQHSAIWISNSGSGNNFRVLENIIGYASNAGTGSYNLTGVQGSSFVPVYLNVAASQPSLVDANAISSINLSGAFSGTGANAPLRCIHIAAGQVQVGNLEGNLLGSLTGYGSIVLNTSATGTAEVCGIYLAGTGSSRISGNRIGSFRLSTSATGAVNFYGIRINASPAAILNCSDNIVGGSLPYSIQSLSAANGSVMRGILDEGPSGIIENNVISNFSISGGTGSDANASLIGISVNAPGASHRINHNIVHSLANTLSVSANVTGIYYNGNSNAGQVSANLVHSLTVASTVATAQVNGIVMAGGAAICSNNMIRLGIFRNGASVTNGNQFCGILENGGIHKFYFNTVLIAGNDVESGTSGNSYAFQSLLTSGSRDYRNNIFSNERSNNSGSGKHYAVKIAGGTGIMINYNMYSVSGTGGVMGSFNGIDQPSFADWQSVTGQDMNSHFEHPEFLQPMESWDLLDLHINPILPTTIESGGQPIADVTVDFDNENRDVQHPDIGADEMNGISQSPLPVRLLLFNASRENNATVLKWITSSESGACGFWVERSLDGQHFIPLALVRTKSLQGNSEQNNEYSYTDDMLLHDRTWYRLRMVDLDSNEQWSPVVWVQPGAEKVNSIILYPNPVRDILNIGLTLQQADRLKISVIGMKGEVVRQKEWQAGKGFNASWIDLFQLKAGIYVLHLEIIRNGKHIYERFVKQ